MTRPVSKIRPSLQFCRPIHPSMHGWIYYRPSYTFDVSWILTDWERGGLYESLVSVDFQWNDRFRPQHKIETLKSSHSISNLPHSTPLRTEQLVHSSSLWPRLYYMDLISQISIDILTKLECYLNVFVKWHCYCQVYKQWSLPTQQRCLW